MKSLTKDIKSYGGKITTVPLIEYFITRSTDLLDKTWYVRGVYRDPHSPGSTEVIIDRFTRIEDSFAKLKALKQEIADE